MQQGRDSLNVQEKALDICLAITHFDLILEKSAKASCRGYESFVGWVHPVERLTCSAIGLKLWVLYAEVRELAKAKEHCFDVSPGFHTALPSQG